jgi:hypothetical protein
MKFHLINVPFRHYFQLIFIWYALYIITYYQITKCCIVFLTVDLYWTYFVFHILVSPCDSLSCLNDGSCRVEAGVAACFCKGDYSATTCEGTKLYIFSLPFLNYSWIFYFYLNPRAAVVMIIWYWDLQLPMQSVPITTKVVSSNTVHDEVYSIQHYVIKFVSDLRQVGGFLRVIWFPQPIKLTASLYLKYCWKWR